MSSSSFANYSSTTKQAVKNDIANRYAGGTKTDTTSAEKSITTCPADFDVNNISSDWSTDNVIINSANLHTQGDLSAFSVEDGVCGVEVANDVVFKSRTDDFVIIAEGTNITKSGCTYTVFSAETADVSAQTYFIACEMDKRMLIASVTYSNYVKELVINDKIAEPKITIWILPKKEKPSVISNIANGYDSFLYCSYRKG